MIQKIMAKMLLPWFLTFAMALLFCIALPTAVKADTNVCEIVAVDGTTVLNQYTDFPAALTAVADGQTIRLLADIGHGDRIVFNSKSFNIDVNGHVLTVNPTGDTCITATNGFDLLVKDTSGGGSLHLITAGTNVCGIYATGSGSTVTVDADTAITITNSDNACGLVANESASITLSKATTIDISGGPGVGVYALNGSFIDVQDGAVTMGGDDSSGIRSFYDSVTTASTVLFHGDVIADQSDSYGIYANDHGAVTVFGNVSGGLFGVYGISDTAIYVYGDVNGGEDGAYTGLDGTVVIEGNVTTSETEGYGARIVSGGQMDIDGHVNGGYYGAAASGSDSILSVTGSVKIKALDGYGVLAEDGGNISVGGSVKANGGCGAYARAGTNGSEITIDGTISAQNYINIAGTIKTRANDTQPTTKPGYLTYTGGTPACSVWVKNQITAFAWVVYSDGSFPTGPATLKLVNSDTLASLASVDSSFYMTGADFVGDQLYGVGFSGSYHSGLYKIDPETGAYQLIADSGDNLLGFTYDAVNKTAYVVSLGSNYGLFKINLATASLTWVGPNDSVAKTYMIVDIAADNNGHLYGLDIYNDLLVSLDPANGNVTEIGSLGLDINYAQDIAYDRDNEILYGTLYPGSSTDAGLYQIDTATGAATKIQGYPYEIDAFAIPYVNTGAASIEITSQPTDVTVTKGSITGNLTCHATVSNGGTPTYAWYSCTDTDKTGAAAINTTAHPTAATASFTIPTTLTAGTYYYFCRVSAAGAADVDSSVAKVTVNNIPSHTIVASAGSHGSISPNGSVSVAEHADRAFTITPDHGYVVADVLVDGVSVGAVTSYTFTNVTANHTIAVSFVHHCLAKQFKDVDITKWYHEGIDFVLLEGLFKGTSDTTFAPDSTMTRAMLVTVLYRLEGEPATAAANPFHDVAANQWYTKAVIWAAENNIVKGYDATTFGTNDPVTREQMATLLYRYAQYKGYDLGAGDSYNLLSFSDGAKVSAYAVTAMKWACGQGIIQGDSNKLRPGDNSTRAQVATMLMRFVKSTTK